MSVDARLQRAADDAKAAVATTDLEALRMGVKARAAVPLRAQRLRSVLQVAAVLLVGAVGTGLVVRAMHHASSAKFATVGSAINTAGGGASSDRALSDGAQPDAYAGQASAAAASARWNLTLQVRVAADRTTAGASSTFTLPSSVATTPVRVLASGLRPGGAYAVEQCLEVVSSTSLATTTTTAAPPWRCDPTTVHPFTALPAGKVDLQMGVRRHLTPSGAHAVDCAAAGTRCVLAVVATTASPGGVDAGVARLVYEPPATGRGSTSLP